MSDVCLSAVLADLLTAQEAREVADRLQAGQTLTQASLRVREGVRQDVCAALGGLSGNRLVPGCWAHAVDVLRAIQVAKAAQARIDPVWTTPGAPSSDGTLNASRSRFVLSAQVSVVCSTYNMQKGTALWDALAQVSGRGVPVKLYLDTSVCDSQSKSWQLTTDEAARALPNVAVFRTRVAHDGTSVCNHAKFIVVDHREAIVTSANFSAKAESGNVELGVRVCDAEFSRGVERQYAKLEESVFERVQP